jgi:hypothetical protein
MAIPKANACIYPQDLEAASLALDQELGDRFAENLALLEQVDSDFDAISSGLDQGQQILNELLINGDGTSNLKTTDDVSDQFFLQKDEQPSIEDERFLYWYDVILADGILYGPGSVNNVEALRRLYIACGRNLDTTAKYLAGKKPPVFHNNLQIIKVPPKNENQAYSLAEIKTLLGITYIGEKDIAVTVDNSTLVITRDFLSADQSLEKTKTKFSVMYENIITDVFHFLQVDNSIASIERFQVKGYSGDYLTAILSETDYINLATFPIDTSTQNNKKKASKIISKIDFVLNRFEKMTSQTRVSFKNEIVADISALQLSHTGSISDSIFRVTTILDVDILKSLRDKHSDTAIIDLLEQRQEILSINLEPTDEELQKIISRAVNSASPGSTVGSNKALNSGVSTLSITDSLLVMSSYLENARSYMTRTSVPVIEFFKKTRVELVKYLESDVSAETTTTSQNSTVANGGVLQGQPSGGSPSSILSEYFDPGRTLQIDNRVEDLNSAYASLYELYPEKLVKPLIRIIDMITKKFLKSLEMCDLLINLAKNKIMPLKRKLDAFMSHFLSLTGSGSFETSLLKCAINFDIGLSTSLLDDLLALLDNIGAFISGFLGKLAAWISNLLEKLLCIPVNLINAFLGEVEVKLPSACQIPRVSLGAKLSDALRRLRFVGDIKNTALSGFNRDLVKYRLLIDAAPNKLKRFNDGALCNSSTVGSFYNAAMLNLSGSALPNPLAG